MWRGLLTWFLTMAIESLLGTLRLIFLAPLVGVDTADRVGWPFGLVVVLLVAWLLIRWTGLTSTRSLLALGAIWAALTLFLRSPSVFSVALIGRASWPRSIQLKAGY